MNELTDEDIELLSEQQPLNDIYQLQANEENEHIHDNSDYCIRLN